MTLRLKTIIAISVLLLTLTACGKQGVKKPYPNYPKEYPSNN